ncbi:hypothetical protein, conserved [Babesia ovata]|uniref:Uncharacterized protein n=1 Tax=Babesia ovata TaxID=189622 RepID=A0A2H6KAV0_9APIC|nr:uncharacterized protein BOVATA_016110 [Babesia ovata]GBE60118.1 hypothetical protein, conserved [Babesia ovata]
MEEISPSAAAQVPPFEAAARTSEAVTSDESEGTSSSYDSDQFLSDNEMRDHKDPERKREPEPEREPEQPSVDDGVTEETESQPRVHRIMPRHVPEPEPEPEPTPVEEPEEEEPEERRYDSDSDRDVRSSDSDYDYHYGRRPYSSSRHGISSSDYEEFDISSAPRGRNRGLSARCHYYNEPEEPKVAESAGGAPGSYDVAVRRKPLIIRAKNCVQNMARKPYDAVAKLTRYCKKQFS